MLFRANGLLDGEYMEPYAGGAGVALALLFEDYASHIHINDLDPLIYAFWHSVLFECEDLCAMVRRKPLTMAQWRRQRSVLEHHEKYTTLEIGFAAFYLNRTNRSGIITGGPIGGTEQMGEWGIDARFNRDELVTRIRRIATFKDRITLTNLDAADLLSTKARALPVRSLLYLDPPYYVAGTQRLYASYYRPEDHADVARLLSKVGRPWLVSYDDAPEIRALYNAHRFQAYDLRYTAADRYDGAEIMFFSDDLKIPRVSDPAKVDVSKLRTTDLAVR